MKYANIYIKLRDGSVHMIKFDNMDTVEAAFGVMLDIRRNKESIWSNGTVMVDTKEIIYMQIIPDPKSKDSQ